ncbi:ABC transporter ATP-binding protein [Acidisphaera sp. L21]|uniref:ABC transporter ATP-binding protein n=1 Tax=Acidisphaera sp. L21 TaxID=1641851 RepID=UPI001576A42A|nr:ABC transporter ATP-binding protein [Acidisphaera sp. L21]
MDARTPASLLAEPGNNRLLRRLWRDHLARYRGRMFVILVVTAIMAGLTALYPLVIDRAFSMFAARDRRILYQVPALVVIITAAKAASTYAQTVLTQGLVLRIIRELQARMFAHLTTADLSRVEREAPAQLAARFTTDAAIIREALTRAIGGIANGITVVGLIASMLWMDWVLSLIAAALYPLAALPIQRLGKRIRRASGGMQERMGEAAGMLTESFSQARTVRAYRLEAVETERANQAFGHLNKALMRMTRTRSAVDPMLEVLGGVAIAAVMGFAGWRAAVGTNTVGNFTGFVAALLIASQPLRALGSLNAAVQEGMAGLSRVFSVIDEQPGIVEQPGAVALPAGHGRVVFQDVRFLYPDGREGLRGLSFVAEPGMTVALVGASGAGKSTALALIPRLHDVSSGSITVDGADLRQVSLQSLRDAIAYVGQDTMLFDDTVGANIAMGRPGADPAAIEAAAEAAAAGFIADLPEGFDMPVGTGGGRLSGGQRQRVALARALLRDPRILLLDEATSALDAESEAAVQQALARLRAGRTTIVVAHRLSTVRDADLVVAMADGAVVEQGTHAELMSKEGLYARLVRTQAFAT